MSNPYWNNATDRPIGWQLQPADENVMRALDAFGILTWRQLKKHFYGSDRTTTRRLTNLTRSGLITADRNLENLYGKLYSITRRGLRTIGSQHAPYDFKLGSDQTHTLGLADVLLPRITQGFGVLTEHEITAAMHGREYADVEALARIAPERNMRKWLDTTTEPSRYQYLTVPVNGRPRIPDAAIMRGDELVAIELEIALKTPQKLRQILAGYAHPNSPYDRVMWVCSPKVRTRLVGPSGLLFEQAGFRSYANPQNPRTWALEWPRTPASEDLYGLHTVYPFRPTDEGVKYGYARAIDPSARLLKRTEWCLREAARERAAKAGS